MMVFLFQRYDLAPIVTKACFTMMVGAILYREQLSVKLINIVMQAQYRKINSHCVRDRISLLRCYLDTFFATGCRSTGFIDKHD